MIIDVGNIVGLVYFAVNIVFVNKIEYNIMYLIKN